MGRNIRNNFAYENRLRNISINRLVKQTWRLTMIFVNTVVRLELLKLINGMESRSSLWYYQCYQLIYAFLKYHRHDLRTPISRPTLLASTATTTATGSHGVAGQPDSQTAVCQSTGGAEGRERDVRGGGGGGGGGGCSYVGTCGGASPVQAAAAATTAVSVVGEQSYHRGKKNTTNVTMILQYSYSIKQFLHRLAIFNVRFNKFLLFEVGRFVFYFIKLNLLYSITIVVLILYSVGILTISTFEHLNYCCTPMG
ncbi:LOW QUALITY PROTEIN: hypothetical protein V1477_005678 [Vespula maculifrons]|uniref:Uncharacterized protein n=1 Tax=Vespula maculifrons TaxID=7453 RepID=A0ABD2CLP0_VESMC